MFRQFHVDSSPPSVAGGQWAKRRDGQCPVEGREPEGMLDSRGVKTGALQVRFNGLDTGILPQTPDFMKSLDVDHSIDGEVMVAYADEWEAAAALEGYPLRLVVPLVCDLLGQDAR